MTTLDLQHMIVFDASQTHGQHTVTGDCNLTPNVTHDYFTRLDLEAGSVEGEGRDWTRVGAARRVGRRINL